MFTLFTLFSLCTLSALFTVLSLSGCVQTYCSADGRCVPASAACDGTCQCSDCSDEAACATSQPDRDESQLFPCTGSEEGERRGGHLGEGWGGSFSDG